VLNQQAGQISKHHQDFVKQKGNIRQNEVLNQQAEHNQTHAVFFIQPATSSWMGPRVKDQLDRWCRLFQISVHYKPRQQCLKH